MNPKITSTYGWLLILGGAYYAIVLAISFEAAISSWRALVETQYDFGAYLLLMLIVLMGVGTPLIMFWAGYRLVRTGSVSIGIAILLSAFLLLASLAGKLLLVLGAILLAYNRLKRAIST